MNKFTTGVGQDIYDIMAEKAVDASIVDPGFFSSDEYYIKGVEVSKSEYYEICQEKKDELVAEKVRDDIRSGKPYGVKRNKKVDVPTEQWQKDVERRLDALEKK